MAASPGGGSIQNWQSTNNACSLSKSAEIKYLKPARLDDLLAVHSKITRVGPASINFEQLAMLSGELLCESNIQVCCVNRKRFDPRRLIANLELYWKRFRNNYANFQRPVVDHFTDRRQYSGTAHHTSFAGDLGLIVDIYL